MGALMRSFDWSHTKLGPVASWPQSLRTAVSIMLDSAFGMVVAWGPEFIFLYNDRYRPILGATKHPGALGSPTREIFPEIWHFIGPLFEKTRHGEAVALDDVLIAFDRNGYLEDCYFTLSYSPIRDETGGVGGLLAVVAETTERVQGERRLVTLRDLAALGEARNADDACGLAEKVLSGNCVDIPFSLLYLLEPDGRHARRTGATGLGRDAPAAAPSVALDQPDGWRLGECYSAREPIIISDLPVRFGPMPGGPYDEPAHTAVVLPMLRAGHDEPHGFFIAGVSPHRALDDRYRTFFELARDHIVAAIGNALAYEEERKRAEALAEIDRAKTAFFSNISHEFRTPLTLMLGPMEDALARGGLTGDDLDTAFRNALRLQKLVNALLDFSRIEAGRMRATYVATDVSRFTSDLASMFESAIARAGLRYVARCGPVAEPIYLDRDMYEKIVLNLLSNALKFTFDGEIGIALRDAGAHVELRVRDTGVGVAPDTVPRLFERFHRVEGTRARTHEGSGIGLALVSELVKLHGGSVAADSVLGKGTTFTVTIPKGQAHLPADKIGEATGVTASAASAAFVEEALRWLPAEAGDRTPQHPGPHPTIGAPAVPAARVLVADDNADMRDYLRRVLAPHYHVDTVWDGAAALEAARRAPPDLVLTDVMMPNLDGYGLLRALRDDELTRSLPIVMLSARAGEESRIEGLQAGADDYLVKPFSARELIARVRTHLELSRLRRDAELQSKKLHALFEQAPAVICVLAGPDHVHRLANPPYLEVIGHRRVLGLPVRQALPELEGQEIVEVLDRVYATEEPYVGVELPIKLLRHGVLEDTYWNFVCQPYRDLDGRVEGVMAFGFEVTAQVVARQRAEALARQVQASEEALRESEQQFRMLADTMPLLAWYANPDGYIPWYNQRWYEYTGTTLDGMKGWNWQSVHDPEDVARVAAKWRAALASGEPWEDQFRLRRHDGELRWFLSRALPLRDRHGRIVRWFGTNVDIDDQKRAEAEAEAANCAKDEFLAVLGHELRNPLSPILTALHLMRLRDGDHAAKERAVIERQAQHLVRLVDDLLDVSRITRGKVELKRQRIEVAHIVARAVEMASPLLEQRRHNLRVTVPSHGLVVDGDPDRLAQVISNLLTNAAKYTEHDGRITIAARNHGDEIAISVKDTGIGIAPEMLPRVFEMFVQERQALDRSRGGLGLGLTIARNLVTMHGGSVDVVSEGRHRGAEFTVRIPAARPADDAVAPRERGPSSTPRSRANGGRILVVDDNEDAADLLAASLEGMGYTVRVTYDGPEALKVASGFGPDIAVLDIGLPVMDGYELARRLREQPKLERLHLVAVIGYGQETDRRRSCAAGFAAHLVKPFDLDVIASLITQLTQRKPQLRK